jgi:hypothetical protein
MRVVINGKTVVFPSSLSEFTLGQRIDFHNAHGRDLEAIAKTIRAMPDGLEKELEVTEFNFEQMFRSFSFFCGFPVETIKQSEYVDTVAEVYYSSLKLLFEQESEIELHTSFEWMGEAWELQSPSLKQGDKMTYGEFIDAKQIVKDLDNLGASRWESLLPLCAIYLRKKDEPYTEELVYENSDRLKLMRSLPMDIALQVGFFLSSITSISTNISLSSGVPESKAPASIAASILKGGGGSTS